MGEPTYRPLLRVADVGKVQRGEDSGFTLEAGEPISIAGKRLRQDPERHLGVQLGIGGLVDLSHTPLADEGGDPVVGESGADVQGHWILGRVEAESHVTLVRYIL